MGSLADQSRALLMEIIAASNAFRGKLILIQYRAVVTLMLGIAAWAAVKNALSYVSAEAATSLNLPATGEEVLRCLTQTTSLQREKARANE